jgi:hypothetical protein
MIRDISTKCPKCDAPWVGKVNDVGDPVPLACTHPGCSHLWLFIAEAGPGPIVPLPSAALDRQEGGDHYKKLAIQPVEYIHANGIGFCEGSAIKYLTRWRAKGGIEDLRKARHFIDLLIEMEAKGVPHA